MQKKAKIFALFLCFMSPFFARADGGLLQKTAFYMADDTAVNLIKYQGKPIVVFLWGKDCPICLSSLPMIDALYKKWGEELVIIPLMTKNASLLEARKAYSLRNVRALPIYIDKKDVFSLIAEMNFMPLVLIFDSNGTEIFRKAGKTEWLPAKLKEIVKPLSVI